VGIFSTIVGAVAPALIGGLFRRKQKPPKQSIQTVKNEVDYEQLRKSAEAAGFNPLTALRNGGSAGFTQTHSPVLSARTSNSIIEGIGAGLSAGVQAAFDYNPLDEQRAELELEIMKGQLDNISRANKSEYKFGEVPVATGTRNVSVGPLPEAGITTVTNPNPVNSGQEVHPHFKDAEHSETRYGDLVQEVAGLQNLIADGYWNLVEKPNSTYNRATAALSRKWTEYFGDLAIGNTRNNRGRGNRRDQAKTLTRAEKRKKIQQRMGR
jgi:hypothetical protein